MFHGHLCAQNVGMRDGGCHCASINHAPFWSASNSRGVMIRALTPNCQTSGADVCNQSQSVSQKRSLDGNNRKIEQILSKALCSNAKQELLVRNTNGEEFPGDLEWQGPGGCMESLKGHYSPALKCSLVCDKVEYAARCFFMSSTRLDLFRTMEL